MARSLSLEPRYKLNTVCPYYTMFPLEFPLTVLKSKRKSINVLDPFCGRGTTNFAAQSLGFTSYGLDSSPVAVAIAKAKLAKTSPKSVKDLLSEILDSKNDYQIPEGDFWKWAYHPSTLEQICKLRTALKKLPESDESIMLRAVALGCLHGPLLKNMDNPSYFSNQMPRTFSSKPDYSVKYWKERDQKPPYVDIRGPIHKKLNAVMQQEVVFDSKIDNILLGDSRDPRSFEVIKSQIDLVITSPPYYGMRTYVQDQWLRYWFIGGPETINYTNHEQVTHISPESFSVSLANVWNNIVSKSSENLQMVIRFGGIPSRNNDYDRILRHSLEIAESNLHVYRSRNAGSSSKGRRQASVMGTRAQKAPIEEKDYFIRLS